MTITDTPLAEQLLEQDKHHRALALDATKSFIVQAPAGSGKTALLIQRFLKLLTQVEKPEEILAITFTKKAANEMRARIIKALQQATNIHDLNTLNPHEQLTYQIAKQVLEKDKLHQWHLIDNPNQLRIQTIDSFCTYLTKQMPLLSLFGSPPNITAQANSLYHDAVQEILTHLEGDYAWSPAIANLLLHLDNDLNKLRQLLVNLLAKRDQWLPYIHLQQDSAAIRLTLENQIKLIINDALSHAHSLIPLHYQQELIAIARFSANQLCLLHKNSHELIACSELTELPIASIEYQKAWLGIAKLLLTKTHTWRKRVDEDIGFPALTKLTPGPEKDEHVFYRQRLLSLIQSLSAHDELQAALKELSFLPSPSYTDKQWQILEALLQVLKMVAAQLRLSFEQHSEIDFIENARAALNALGSPEQPTDLALLLDYQIRHILVDEFQDTSSSQYQLLNLLITGWQNNDGRTLFVVGDPMQSIYRFREAEVGLFMRMSKQGIGQLKLIPLTLSVNFRSTSTVVTWNNVHFKSIFPNFNDMTTGAVSYKPSVAHTALSIPSSHVHLIGFESNDSPRQAEWIGQSIKQLLETESKASIAILVRSRTHLTTVIPVLKKLDIPFRAVDIDPLNSRQPIQDLLALTKALLNLYDRIAWLAVLRAPWCGLTLADLLVIADSSTKQPILSQITDPDRLPELSTRGYDQLRRIAPILKTKVNERQRTTIRDWIETTWLQLGGPACLDSAIDLNDTQAFFNLLSELQSTKPFFSSEELTERVTHLFANAENQSTNLQIMTIHTAKGLEFDHVFLPRLERKLPYDDKNLLAWMEQPLTQDKTALLLAPLHGTGENKELLYEYIYRKQQIKSSYEAARLFYVAATRAKKCLYMSFDLRLTDGGNPRTEPGSFLHYLWPLIKHSVTIQPALHPLEMDNLNSTHQQPLKRLTPNWQNPLSFATKKTTSYHQQLDGFQFRDHSANLIGTMTHRLLYQLSLQGIAWWIGLSHQKKMAYLHHHLLQLGLPVMKINDAIKAILQMTENTLNDERGRWILHTHQHARSELALTMVIDQHPVQLVIDRTFVDDSGTCWIIDYKTSSTDEHQSLEHFINQEKEKYDLKMQQYSEALRQLGFDQIKIGLYFPAIPAWCEWPSYCLAKTT